MKFLSNGKLDYMIEHCKEVINKNKHCNKKCSKEHEDLMCALKELKRYRSKYTLDPYDIEEIEFKNLDINNEIFNVSKTDYKDFEDWFKKLQKSKNNAYIIKDDNNKIVGIIALKIESIFESYVVPSFKNKNFIFIKIRIFNVLKEGEGIGKALLNKVEEICKIHNFKDIYITFYEEKHPDLIKFLEKNEFYKHGIKTTTNEAVYCKDLRKKYN